MRSEDLRATAAIHPQDVRDATGAEMPGVFNLASAKRIATACTGLIIHRERRASCRRELRRQPYGWTRKH
jgi:hypothetical protein